MSLFHNLVHIFGGGSMNQIVDSQQASQLIKNVDDTVHESWKMLLALKALLPAPELQAIEFEHNQLYLMVVEVKSDVRGRQGRQVFFANATERDEFYVQVQQLLERCKIHHNDLMSVSRRAYQRALEAQAAGPSSASPTPVSTNQGDRSSTRWLSIVSESTPSDSSECEVDLSSLSQSGSESNDNSQRFIATVAHIPSSAPATENELESQRPNGNSYYRILICANEQRQAVVVDTDSHRISASYNREDAERSRDEILQVGDMLMNSNPQQLEGHQEIHSYRGPSFFSSFFSSWHYSSLPLGGTV